MTKYFAKSLLQLIVVGIGLLGTSVQGQTPGGSGAKEITNPVKPTPQSISQGEQLFQKRCAFCHGKDAKGNGPLAPKGSSPSDLTDDKWDRGSTDGEIFSVVRDGAGPKSVMKGLKGKLTDEQMWHLVNYLRSLSSGDKRR
jgi:mono/diheme cytochrome c family protein